MSQAGSWFQTVKYMNVVSMTILVFDYFLTIEREIKFIWKSRWCIGKILFLLSRYPTFIDVPLVLYYSMAPHVPADRCPQIYRGTSWSTTFGIGMAEAILVLRTYAVWGRSKKLLTALLLLYFVVYVPVIFILQIYLQSMKYDSPRSPAVTGCQVTESSDILFVDFVLLMLFETVILILTLYQGMTRFRYTKGPLVATLYRDGVLHFVYLFLISSGNVVVIVAFSPELVDLLNTFQRVMHSILSTRILLHLHEACRARDLSNLSIPVSQPLHFSVSGQSSRRTTVEFTIGYDIPYDVSDVEDKEGETG